MSAAGRPVHHLVPQRGPRSAFAAGVLALAVALTAAGCGGGGSSSSTPSSTSADRTSSAEVSTSTANTTSTAKHGLPPLKKKLLNPPSPADAVQLALTSPPRDAALVCRFYSDALLKSAYGDVNGCVAAIKSGGSAKSAKIVSSKTSGSTATVIAVPSGGPSSGERLTYTLVMENGSWRLDQVKSNVKVGP